MNISHMLVLCILFLLIAVSAMVYQIYTLHKTIKEMEQQQQALGKGLIDVVVLVRSVLKNQLQSMSCIERLKVDVDKV